MSKHAFKPHLTPRNLSASRRCGYYGCSQWFTVQLGVVAVLLVIFGSYVTGRAFSVAASPGVPKNSVQPGGSLHGAASWAWSWLGFRAGWFTLCFALVACGGVSGVDPGNDAQGAAGASSEPCPSASIPLPFIPPP